MASNNKKKILVTGGAGFIGSALIRYLINNTNYYLVNLDNLSYASNLESLKSVEHSENYKFIKVSICNSKKIGQIINEYKPNIIIHLAAESHVDRSIDYSLKFIKSNIIGTFNLLEGSRNYYTNLSNNEKNKFLFYHISTDEVFGDLDYNMKYFSESSNYNPSSPYSATKASSDHLVRAWHRTYGLPIIISNCSNNYGFFQHPEKFIPHMIINCILGKKLPVYGDGKNIRDWLFVDDHVDAIMKIIKKGKIGDTYCIGGNSEFSNFEVVNLICSYLNTVLPSNLKRYKELQDLICFVKDRPGHDLRYAIDTKKIQRELNWKPKVTFQSGIKHTIDWYINNQKWWKKIIDRRYNLQRQGLGN